MISYGGGEASEDDRETVMFMGRNSMWSVGGGATHGLPHAHKTLTLIRSRYEAGGGLLIPSGVGEVCDGVPLEQRSSSLPPLLLLMAVSILSTGFIGRVVQLEIDGTSAPPPWRIRG